MPFNRTHLTRTGDLTLTYAADLDVDAGLTFPLDTVRLVITGRHVHIKTRLIPLNITMSDLSQPGRFTQPALIIDGAGEVTCAPGISFVAVAPVVGVLPSPLTLAAGQTEVVVGPIFSVSPARTTNCTFVGLTDPILYAVGHAATTRCLYTNDVSVRGEERAWSLVFDATPCITPPAAREL